MGLADAYVHDLRVVAVVPVACVASDDGIRRLYGIAFNVEQIRACRSVEFLPYGLFAPRAAAEQVLFQCGDLSDGGVFRNLGMVDNHGRAVTPFVRRRHG